MGLNLSNRQIAQALDFNSAAEPPELEFRFIGETRGLEFARQARGGRDDDPPGDTAEPANHGGAST
jgi:hypothetical protein